MSTIAELRSVAQAGKQSDPGWYRIHRRISIHVTRAALALGVEADHVSLVMMGCTLAAALLIASTSAWLNLAGFAFGYAGFLLDKVDGEVARLRGRTTMRGILLDRFHHRLIEPTLLLAVSLHEYRLTGSLAVLVAGFAAMLLGNAIDENQHLAAVVLTKHMRQRGALPELASGSPEGSAPAEPPSALARLHRRLRPLKAARTVALWLPISAVAYGLERLVHRPVPGWCLEAGALGLGAFLLVQCAWYWREGLEREAADVANVLRQSVVDDAVAGAASGEPDGTAVQRDRERAGQHAPGEIGERWAV